MPYSTLVLVLACVLGVVYGVLALAAFTQAKPEGKGKFFSPLLWMDPWWPFYDNRYLPTAKNKCFMESYFSLFSSLCGYFGGTYKNARSKASHGLTQLLN